MYTSSTAYKKQERTYGQKAREMYSNPSAHQPEPKRAGNYKYKGCSCFGGPCRGTCHTVFPIA